MNRESKPKEKIHSRAIADQVTQKNEGIGIVDQRIDTLQAVIQRVDYRNKPWCTSRLQSKTTTFDKRYFRNVTSHEKETDFLKDAVAAANAITGHSSQDDYTETRGHKATKPTDASEI